MSASILKRVVGSLISPSEPVKAPQFNPRALIELRDVSKYYQSIRAVNKISFSISSGEFVSIVGPSGAGKSTLVKLLIAEESPSSGSILVAGREIINLTTNELPYYRRKIGVVFQDFKLLRQKTVAENIAFALEVSDFSNQVIEDRLDKILRLVGLEYRASNYILELSGGEKQRVSIARALVHLPKILIADEPTGNLDPGNAQDIIKLLLKINSRGTTVILATHNKTIVDSLRRRVIALKTGQLEFDRPVSRYMG